MIILLGSILLLIGGMAQILAVVCGEESMFRAGLIAAGVGFVTFVVGALAS